jgi:hypothetical protein
VPLTEIEVSTVAPDAPQHRVAHRMRTPWELKLRRGSINETAPHEVLTDPSGGATVWRSPGLWK